MKENFFMISKHYYAEVWKILLSSEFFILTAILRDSWPINRSKSLTGKIGLSDNVLFINQYMVSVMLGLEEESLIFVSKNWFADLCTYNHCYIDVSLFS